MNKKFYTALTQSAVVRVPFFQRSWPLPTRRKDLTETFSNFPIYDPIPIDESLVSPPSFATAFGFTHEALFDHFTSLSTIDTGKTYAPGYKWYVRSTTTATHSISGSILTVNGDHGGQLQSASNTVPFHASPNPIASSVGQLISGSDGFYMEARIQVRADQAPGTSWGNFWCIDFHQWNHPGATQPNTTAEIDVQETWTPPQDTFQTYHSWSTTFADSFQQASGAGAFNNIDWTQYHLWGVLVVPSAKNSGTGLMRFYVDRIQRGGDITWTSGTTYDAIEHSHVFVMAEGFSPLTYNVDYIGVWNSGAGWDGPTTNLTHRWPMNNARVSGTTITDVVGSLHGTAGSGISSAIGPLCDQARLSNGIAGQGYITLPSAPIASLTSAWSIAGWLKITTVGSGTNLTIFQLDDGTTQLRFVVDRTTTIGALCATKNGSVSQFATTTAVFDSGFYHHFIVTYNGSGTYKVYKDGIQMTLGGTPQVANPNTGNCFLAQTSSMNSVNGAGAQWVTYTKELTAAEVIQLFNAYETN